MMHRSVSSISYSETTRDLRVTVQPQFLEHESAPENRAYTYAYTVTIENFGLESVQLMSRHWIIESGGAPYSEVRGEGVVGEQPTLEMGDAYQYTSGVVIRDTFGSMYGTYTFQGDQGDRFTVTIPRFDLIYPKILH